jgi:ribosomal protein L37AE/L43A
MTIKTNKNAGTRSQSSFCPKCGRKGVSCIKQQYYRCRYCGAYMLSPTEKYNM